jgi:hypothetical protein
LFVLLVVGGQVIDDGAPSIIRKSGSMPRAIHPCSQCYAPKLSQNGKIHKREPKLNKKLPISLKSNQGGERTAAEVMAFEP